MMLELSVLLMVQRSWVKQRFLPLVGLYLYFHEFYINISTVHNVGYPRSIGAVSVINHYYGRDDIVLGAFKGQFGKNHSGTIQQRNLEFYEYNFQEFTLMIWLTILIHLLNIMIKQRKQLQFTGKHWLKQRYLVQDGWIFRNAYNSIIF